MQQGHSRSDPGAYRPPGELEAWLARDPIVRLEQALEAVSRATPDQLARLRAEVSAEIAEASARAQAWPEPSAASLLEDVYA